MALCGLSLHLGSSEGYKTPEQKSSFKQALLSPMVSMNAFHSANLFLFSHHHIPTNSIAPFSAYKYTHNPQFLQLLWWRAIARKTSAFKLYKVANFHYQLNSVNNTKLPCYTLPLTQHHSFYTNLPPLPAQQSNTQHELAEKKINSSVLISFSEYCRCSCIQDPVLPIFCLSDNWQQTGWVLAGFSLCYNQVS